MAILLTVKWTVCIAIRTQIIKRSAIRTDCAIESEGDRRQQLTIVSNEPGQATTGTVKRIYIFYYTAVNKISNCCSDENFCMKKINITVA